MSDAEVLSAILQMEEILRADPGSLDAEAIEKWHNRFRFSVDSAERGPGWSQIVARAQSLQTTLESTVSALASARDALKKEMEMQSMGHRALKAYRPPVPD